MSRVLGTCEAVLRVQIDAASNIPLKVQLRNAFQEMFRSGMLPPGSRLPSTRALASRLGVSRSTIVEVFSILLADGHLIGRIGSGTFVASIPPPRCLPRREIASHPLSTRAEHALAQRTQDESEAGDWERPALSLEHFPTSAWSRSLTRAAREQARPRRRHDDIAGNTPLRMAILDLLAVRRGIRCSLERIFIVDSQFAAHRLVADLMVNAGTEVGLEDPTPPRLVTNYSLSGAVIRPIAMDDEGLRIDHASSQAARGIVCVTPSHHFPTGVTLSLQRRRAIIQWANVNNILVIEDDVESEYQGDADILPSLYELDYEDRVIYIGSFSTTLLPCLRVAFLIVPTQLVPAVRSLQALTASDRAIDQAALAAFIEWGDYSRYVASMKKFYERKRTDFMDAVCKSTNGTISFAARDKGSFLLARLPPHVRDAEFANAIHPLGVSVTPISSLAPHTAWNGVLVPYARMTADDLHRTAWAFGEGLAIVRSHPALCALAAGS